MQKVKTKYARQIEDERVERKNRFVYRLRSLLSIPEGEVVELGYDNNQMYYRLDDRFRLIPSLFGIACSRRRATTTQAPNKAAP